jgi:DNA-nicking Smr family endonuclease
VAVSDELRFGKQRTLNLREGLPSAAEAVQRAEQWLREQQVKGREEVLIITGRGVNSIGGIAVIRPAVERLLYSLRRFRRGSGSHTRARRGAGPPS